MPSHLLLLADTHLPKRAKDLDPSLWRAIEQADVVVHAGDWVDTDTLDRLERASRRLIACWGNNDGAELRARLPEVAHAEIDGVRLAVTHETGQATGREIRMESAHPYVDLLVFGHSHIPWDTVSPAGMRLLNPGSPTDRRRQPHRTFMTLVLDDGRVGEPVLHRLAESPGVSRRPT